MVSAGSSEGIVFLWDVRRPGPAMLSVAAHSDLSVVRTGLAQADKIRCCHSGRGWVDNGAEGSREVGILAK